MTMKQRYYTLSACALAAALLVGCDRNSGTSAPAAPAASAPAAPLPADTQQAALTTEVFNPGEQAIFAVSSVLVQGKTDAVLIDAQFSAEQARKLADKIKATGKRLTTIYISHGDPDFYFGLDTLQAAFPEAKILATPQTIAHIQETNEAKLKVWGPKLGENAPKQLVVPEPLQGDSLQLEGQTLQLIGLDSPAPDRTVLWIPSIKTVAGGIPVMAGEHVWMADTQTPQSHTDWLAMLDRIKALGPEVVIPGHFVGTMPAGTAAVDFTADYIRAFDEETAKAKDGAALEAALKQRFPNLGGLESLALSAKVAKGEMQWH
ncbi:MBL fold metallo-hydrolase [Comamonas piscis]